jgi:Ran GTPase-activating protein (RanGAP) involved in mRNA processing and transport
MGLQAFEAARLTCKKLAALGKEGDVRPRHLQFHRAIGFLQGEQIVAFLQQPDSRRVLPYLYKLDLSHAHLGAEAFSQFIQGNSLRRLRQLRLLDNNLGDGGAQNLAHSDCCDTLQRLSLGCNALTDRTLAVLFSGNRLRHLVYLDLHLNPLGPQGGELFTQATQITGLTNLCLRQTLLHAQGVQALAASAILSPVLVLNLSDTHMEDSGFSALTALGTPLQRVRSLNVSHNRLTSAALAHFPGTQHLTELTHLDIAWNHVGDQGALDLSAARGPTDLQSLDFGFNWLETVGVAALGQAAFTPRLTHLSVNDNCVTDAGLELFCGSTGLQQLLTLNLRNNLIGAAGMACLTAPGQVESLRTLNLCYNDIGDEGVAFLTNNSPLRHLTELTLDGNRIGTRGAQALSLGDPFPALKRLSLNENLLSVGGACYFAFATFGQLTYLDLSYNEIENGGLKVLSYTRTLRSLHALLLDGNQIDDSGIDWLCQLATFHELTSLSLQHNEVGDAGAGALAASTGMPQLQHLALENNAIGDLGAERLADSPSLRTLTSLQIGGNAMGRVGRMALTQSENLTHLQDLDFDCDTQTDSSDEEFDDGEPEEPLEA